MHTHMQACTRTHTHTHTHTHARTHTHTHRVMTEQVFIQEKTTGEWKQKITLEHLECIFYSDEKGGTKIIITRIQI